MSKKRIWVFLAPWCQDYEDIQGEELLPEYEIHPEMHVNVRAVSVLYDPEIDVDYNFDAVVLFYYDDLDAKEFFEIEYQMWTNVFEDESADAEIYYPEIEDNL